MEKHYLVCQDTDNLEFVLTVEDTDQGTLYQLNHSKADCWTDIAKGKFCCSIIDTGNGLIVSPKLGKNLDYDDFQYLHILMKFITTQQRRVATYEIIPVKNPKTIFTT